MTPVTLAHLPFLSVVAVRTALVLLYLFIALRVLGKRHVNPMHVCDFAFIMAMANAVQNAMTNGKGDLSVGIASGGALLLVGAAVTSLVLRRPTLQKRLFGAPTALIHDGRIEWRNLRRERISERELMQALREHEVPDPKDVRLAVLEVDGQISVIPKA
jgi:uncharacterized membrane protein YcaP (DUF421 family)